MGRIESHRFSSIFNHAMAQLLFLSIFASGANAALIDDPQVVLDCAGVNDVPQSECEALAALYNSAGGGNWLNEAGWLSDPNVCDWFGIACDASPSIREISLSFNNLVGFIPSELGNLANLKFLYLSSNELTGNIPVELGNLTNLIQMELDFNQLTGSIPAELGNLSNLTSVMSHMIC